MKIHFYPEFWPETAQHLTQAGHELTKDIAEADVLVFNSFPTDFPQPLPPNIQFVHYAFAGVDHLRKAGILESSGVRWANAGGLYGESVAESALALMLAVAHMHPHVGHAGSWIYRRADEQTRWLHGGKRVLVVGAGRIGKQLMKFMEPFGPEVVAVNKSGRPVEGAKETYAFDQWDPQKLLPEADFVVVIAPLTEETTGLFGAAEFAAMRETAVFVNVGRGGIVDTEALTRALAEGAIFGAGLDVVDPEPLPDDHPLWGLENVVITPHVATTMERTRTLLGPLMVDNLRAFCAGEKMNTEVDVSQGY